MKTPSLPALTHLPPSLCGCLNLGWRGRSSVNYNMSKTLKQASEKTTREQIIKRILAQLPKDDRASLRIIAKEEHDGDIDAALLKLCAPALNNIRRSMKRHVCPEIYDRVKSAASDRRLPAGLLIFDYCTRPFRRPLN